MKCSYCGEENAESEQFCSNCGMKLSDILKPSPPSGEAPAEPKVRCSNCGFMNSQGVSVCQNCNQPLVAASVLVPGVCPHCGFEKNPSAAKFCMNCGNQIPVEPAPLKYEAKLVLPSMREIILSEPETIIGRGDFLQEISPEEAKYLSREHLSILYEDGKYYILDEKSTNGTKLNGLKITGQGKKELNDNDTIVLADTVTAVFHINTTRSSEMNMNE
ncbi:MAG: zinc ribbon domain-containing protein [Theionarchaea archaeon]|nr:zinc ribbon domain-containing protein [Theionarchaea archaeon]